MFFSLGFSRRRRKLKQLILEWEFVVAESDKADTSYSKKHNIVMKEAPHYFFFWMIDRLLYFMIMYLQLGFELEIYDTHEYYVLFWYMQCLQTQRRNYVNYLFQYTQKQVENTTNNTKNPPKKKGKGKKVQKTSVLPSAYLLQIEAELQMCLGLVRYFGFLSKANKLNQPTLTWGDPEKRFLCRFESFQRLSTPDPLEYSQFLEQTDQLKESKLSDILRSSTEAFKFCKELIQQVIHHRNPPSHFQSTELKAIEKVALTNSINLSLIDQSKLKNDKTIVTYDLQSNYVVINLKEA